MKSVAIAVLLCILAAAVVEGQVCRYNCYNTTSAGANAKEALLRQCGVTNYKVTTTDIAGVYKKAALPGCQTSSCGLYANEAAVQNYRDNCEHPDPKYKLLEGKGKGYNAPCTSCQ